MLAHELSHAYPSCVLIYMVRLPAMQCLLPLNCGFLIATIVSLQLKVLQSIATLLHVFAT